MNHSTVLPLAALSVALGLLLASGHAGAQSTSPPPAPLSQAELSHLVQQQALQIQQLEARLRAVEGGQGTAAATPTPPAPALETRVAALESGQSKLPKVSWAKGAPEFSSADGNTVFRPRGRLFVDASSTDGSAVAERNVSGTEIRSVRLGQRDATEPWAGWWRVTSPTTRWPGSRSTPRWTTPCSACRPISRWATA